MTEEQPILQLPSEIRHIAIEGVIGAGKTTLARMLSEKLGARLVLERFEENPFLPKFYEDPERYAFQTQIFFLLSRYRQQQELFQADLFHSHVITDYIFEKDKIFAYLTLQDEELKLYESLLGSIEKNIPQPDLVIYLQSSVDRLMKNIRIRGREMEESMSDEYIKELNEAYHHFFFHYDATPLLVVETSDFEPDISEEALDDLVKQIGQMGAGTRYYVPRTK